MDHVSDDHMMDILEESSDFYNLSGEWVHESGNHFYTPLQALQNAPTCAPRLFQIGS